jgi:hypothetical protein
MPLHRLLYLPLVVRETKEDGKDTPARVCHAAALTLTSAVGHMGGSAGGRPSGLRHELQVYSPNGQGPEHYTEPMHSLRSPAI